VQSESFKTLQILLHVRLCVSDRLVRIRLAFPLSLACSLQFEGRLKADPFQSLKELNFHNDRKMQMSIALSRDGNHVLSLLASSALGLL
jgi:hypothetical protein